MSITQIIRGTTNNLLNREQEFYNNRIVICRECKLRKIDSIFGEICNSGLWLNPIINEVSQIEKDGFYQGCRCVLGSKTRVPELHCPAKKW